MYWSVPRGRTGLEQMESMRPAANADSHGRMAIKHVFVCVCAWIGGHKPPGHKLLGQNQCAK